MSSQPDWGPAAHRTHRAVASAPVVCRHHREVDQCAAAKGVTVARLDGAASEEAFVAALEAFSKDGGWASWSVAPDADLAWLRAALTTVWLKCTWEHHASFRFWLVVSLEEGQPLQAWAAERAQFVLGAAAVFRRYCDTFAAEFEARELIAAVHDAQYYRVLETRAALPLLAPADVVELFRACPRQDIMSALVEDAPAEVVAAIVAARTADGESAMDAAVGHKFDDAAVLLRGAGARSERFDFTRLLDPAFQPLFDRLLDPWQPFPFDAVASAATVARAGRTAILKRLFECRSDVDFGYADYPLVEACAYGDDALVHCVLDRMSATGVNAFRDTRIAAHFLRAVLADPPSQGVPIPEAAQAVLARLVQALEQDEVRTHVPLASLRRLEPTPALLQATLRVLDVAAEREPDGLLGFFIELDPTNPCAREITELAVERIATREPNPDIPIFDFVRRMTRAGDAAATMAGWAVGAARTWQSLALTKRVDGVTLLMHAVELPPNVAALRRMLEVTPARELGHAVNQEDVDGNNVLVRTCVRAREDPAAFAAHGPALADCMRLLLAAGASPAVRPPRFVAPLFLLCARVGLGAMAAELLVSPEHGLRSFLLETTLNTRALVARRLLARPHKADPRDEETGLERPVHGDPRLAMAPLSMAAWAAIAAFCALPDLGRVAQVSVAAHMGSMADDAWRPHIPCPGDVGPRASARDLFERSVVSVERA